jgi:FKBP-type peptidyl-prolyl cis-trans isomerase
MKSFLLPFAVVLAGIGLIYTTVTKPKLPPVPSSSVTQLVVTELKTGEGKLAASGHKVLVNYTGWLYDEAAPEHKGAKFDSSADHGGAFEFPLGSGQVIKGWEQGVEGMKVGGQRRLAIPPSLGYGDHGAGGVIPPNATLVFDVELVDVH